MKLVETLTVLLKHKDEETIKIVNNAFTNAFLLYRKDNPSFFFSIKKGIHWK